MSQETPQNVTNKGLLIGVSYKLFFAWQIMYSTLMTSNYGCYETYNQTPKDIFLVVFYFEWEIIIVPRQLE